VLQLPMFIIGERHTAKKQQLHKKTFKHESIEFAGLTVKYLSLRNQHAAHSCKIQAPPPHTPRLAPLQQQLPNPTMYI
jgi:hypothetical protein